MRFNLIQHYNYRRKDMHEPLFKLLLTQQGIDKNLKRNFRESLKMTKLQDKNIYRLRKPLRRQLRLNHTIGLNFFFQVVQIPHNRDLILNQHQNRRRRHPENILEFVKCYKPRLINFQSLSLMPFKSPIQKGKKQEQNIQTALLFQQMRMDNTQKMEQIDIKPKKSQAI